MDRNSSNVCPTKLLDSFATRLERKLWRANGLMLVNAILMGAMVVIGTFAPRSGRYTLIRYLLLGASTLFLPIVSNVAATIGGEAYFTSSLFGSQVVAARCEPGLHVVLVLVWTSLVVIIGINTSSAVVADAREGRSIEPPTELLIKAFWVLYLVIITRATEGFSYTSYYIGNLLENDNKIPKQISLILRVLQVLPYAKILPMFFGFYTSRRLVELGHNPRLIVGYMDDHIDDEQALSLPPALIVTGEQVFELEEKPHGYIARQRSKPTRPMLLGLLLRHNDHDDDWTRVRRRRLVTLDRVWQLDDSVMRSQSKDLCFSFALFKLLRCRFAKYTVSQAGFLKASKFFWNEYLRGDNHERVFGLISDELSLIQCCYYSSQPLQYFNRGMALYSLCFTLITFGFCLYLLVFISRAVHLLRGREQVICQVWCPGTGQTSTPQQRGIEFGEDIWYGNTYYDFVPVYIVLVVLLISEAKNIASCIGSNWSKVAVICGYVRSASWQRSPCFQKCICFVLKHWRRSRLLNIRVDRMNQSSVLVLHPWEISVLSRRLFGFLGLANQNTVNVPSKVKEEIYNSLKRHAPASEQEAALKGIPPPSHPLYKPSTVGDGGKVDIASTVLMWHVATSIFEMNRQRHQPPTGAHDQPHRTTATILSRYCAYLVAHRPDLLPEEDDWCKKLYKDAQQEASRVLHKSSSIQNSLRESSNTMLKDGAELADKLMENPNTGWQELAGFWSEMILYLAPSENLDGHAEAIARGGEVITLLWALLAHAGIVDRNDALAPTTSSTAAAADHV